jgi:hypothetical protein
LGHVHDTASAFADFLQNLIVVDLLPNGFVRRLAGKLQLYRAPGGRGGSIERRLGLFVCGQQGVKPSAQLGVAGTFAVEKRGALAGWLGGGQNE